MSSLIDNPPSATKFITSGHNFGEYVMGEKNFVIRPVTKNTATAPIMAIPYSSISLSTVAGKNEVAVELVQPERKNGAVFQGDMVAELRFYVQNNEIDKRGGSEESNNGSDNEEDMSAAKCFN